MTGKWIEHYTRGISIIMLLGTLPILFKMMQTPYNTLKYGVLILGLIVFVSASLIFDNQADIHELQRTVQRK